MGLARTIAIGGAVVLAGMSGRAAEAQTASPVCTLVPGGVEYRSFLPDQKRYVYVAVKVLPGVFPSIFVIVDKNYEDKTVKPVKGDPLAAWWLDRSRPVTFSTDKVKVRWPDTGGINALTSWVSTPDTKEAVQAFRGLQPKGNAFQGTATTDMNTFAFQTRLELTDFSGDAFDVELPSIVSEGVLVTPPVSHFKRDGKIIATAC